MRLQFSQAQNVMSLKHVSYCSVLRLETICASYDKMTLLLQLALTTE